MSRRAKKTKCSGLIRWLTGRSLRFLVIEAGFAYHISPHLYRGCPHHTLLRSQVARFAVWQLPNLRLRRELSRTFIRTRVGIRPVGHTLTGWDSLLIPGAEACLAGVRPFLSDVGAGSAGDVCYCLISPVTRRVTLSNFTGLRPIPTIRIYPDTSNPGL